MSFRPPRVLCLTFTGELNVTLQTLRFRELLDVTLARRCSRLLRLLRWPQLPINLSLPQVRDYYFLLMSVGFLCRSRSNLGEVLNIPDEVDAEEARQQSASPDNPTHPISVQMTYFKPSANNANQRKATVSKDGEVDPQTMTRNQFQEFLLARHGLTGVYQGHPEKGFSFTFSWFGME